MKRMIVNVFGAGLIRWLSSDIISSGLAILGISISFSDLPLPGWIKVLFFVLALILLVLVALIKYEIWRETRNDRINTEDAYEIMSELEDKADRMEGVDPEDIRRAFTRNRH